VAAKPPHQHLITEGHLNLSEYADLEISLYRRDTTNYFIDLRFNHPQSDTDMRLMQGGTPHLCRFNFDHLRSLATDPAAYGKALSEQLFADPAVLAAFENALSNAQTLELPVRVRLLIGSGATELHQLHWETLRHPQQDTLLFTSEQILFSRYMASTDWRPIRIRPYRNLRALVIIANPTNLSTYKPGGQQLAPIDVDGELTRAKHSLGDIPITEITANGTVTLNAISQHMREGYDIIYLVAHGALIDDISYLWLENEDGTAEVTPGDDLVDRIRELMQRPRLIVLASCQSSAATSPTNETEADQEPSADTANESPIHFSAALGPHLSQAGVPAVLAMQDNISMTTVETFMPVLFEEMHKDGQIDRAVTLARGAVRDRFDWWVPVLFMRLKSGRIWYVPHFADTGRGRAEEKWEPFIASIRDEECTPILGPDLTETLVGSRRELAMRMADDYLFPMAPHDRDDFPQVAQYLEVIKSRQFLPRTMLKYLCETIRQRHTSELVADVLDVDLDSASRKKMLKLLDSLIQQVWLYYQEHNEAEPHRVLAELPIPIYITADVSNLLITALTRAGKDPQILLSPWNDSTRHMENVYTDEPDYQPSPEQPLVYYLFGKLDEPDSLVLTEDNYFDYLIGITRNKDLIPACIRSVLTDTALLFMGFRLDDWHFRVFFRSLMNQHGSNRRNNYAHLAVQIAPDEGRILEPQRAQRYLEEYFIKGADISVYWGTVEDFFEELYSRWQGD
jgi:hypothetical protein